MQSQIAQATTPSSPSSVDSKIINDLSIVNEKINLCTSMLLEICPTSISDYNQNTVNTAIDSNDSLLGVIGFLEACVPRLLYLVESGTQGSFANEDTLTRILQVNDDLCKVLADVDNSLTLFKSYLQNKELTPASASTPTAGNITLDNLDVKFDAFSIGDETDAPKNSSTLDDLLASPPAPAAAGPNIVSESKAKDNFDDLFGGGMQGK